MSAIELGNLFVFAWICTRSTKFEACTARLAQSAERKALNLVVVGSSPTVGASVLLETVIATRRGRACLSLEPLAAPGTPRWPSRGAIV